MKHFVDPPEDEELDDELLESSDTAYLDDDLEDIYDDADDDSW